MAPQAQAPGGGTLVSVVLPVYNHARYVAEAIRSVYAQTHRPLELIVIDDGSTDGSAEVVARTIAEASPEDRAATSFEARANKGAHATINEGLARARGDVLTILNSDDAYHPERLAACLAALEERGVGLVYSYVTGIDGEGRDLRADHPWRRWYDHTIYWEMQHEASTSMQLLHANNAVSTGNLVFRRRVLERIGAFRDFRYCHDLDFLLRAAYFEEPVLLRRALYSYRLHGRNTNPTEGDVVAPEMARVVHGYLRTVLRAPSPNPLAPDYRHWGAILQGQPDETPLVRALDLFLEAGPPGREAATPARPRPAASGKRLTVVSHDLSRTGAPMIALQIAREARATGADVAFVSLRDGPLRAEIAAEGFPLRLRPDGRLTRMRLRAGTRLARQAGRWGGAFARAGAELERTVASRRAEAMLAGNGPVLINSFASWSLALALLGSRRRLFWYVHETLRPELMLADEEALAALRAGVASGALAMLYGSAATEALWREHGFGGQVRYWSGLPEQSEEAAPQPATGRPMILSVARAGGRKGTMVLLEGFALARREGLVAHDVELCLVGCPRPSEDRLMRDFIIRAHRPDLVDAVRFVGSVTPAAVRGYYAQADLYVQSSIMECLSLSLLEAMQRGCPVLATDVDGTPEAVVDGEGGLLVPPRDIAALAAGMGRLMSDRVLAARLADASRRRFAEKFSLEATVPALLETVLG